MAETDKPTDIDRRFRGFISARPLSQQLPPLENDRYLQSLLINNIDYDDQLGELDYLGIMPSELTGRVLDVGIGGGRSLQQGVQNNIDIYGLDIALIANIGTLTPGARTQLRQRLARENLTRIKSDYPERFIEADATQHIPFPDNDFDTVIACLSLPIYARNLSEAKRSILEMIRVSKSKVVFASGYSQIPKASEMARYGVGVRDNIFEFCLVDFLKSLEPLGVSHSWTSVNNQSTIERRDIVSAHLDVSKKDQQQLNKIDLRS